MPKKKKEPKLITETFETELVMVKGDNFGMPNEKIKRPYLPKKLEMIQFSTVSGDDKKVVIDITGTKEEIETIKKDKKIKWLKH